MIWALFIMGLIVIAMVLGFLAASSHSELTPWLDKMRRANPGQRHKSEWIAPTEVIDQVVQHYLEGVQYAINTLPKGYVSYARDLDKYMTGAHLKNQRATIDARLRQDTLRLIDILRADHRVRVRYFADDGLACILLDYQTERRLATYHYWSKRRVHTQHLEDTVIVYRMEYDTHVRRWKIAEYIQELPAHYGPLAIDGPLDKLHLTLPPHSGRDD